MSVRPVLVTVRTPGRAVSENRLIVRNVTEPFTIAHHGTSSGAEGRSGDLHRGLCRPARISRPVVRIRLRLHMAFASSRRTDPRSWRDSYLPANPTSAKDDGSSLRSSKRPPYECTRNAGRLHPAPIVTRCACDRFSPSRMVLPRLHDCLGSALPSVRLYVRDVAILRLMRSPSQRRSTDWNVCASAGQLRSLAHIIRPSDLCSDRQDRCAARSIPRDEALMNALVSGYAFRLMQNRQRAHRHHCN